MGKKAISPTTSIQEAQAHNCPQGWHWDAALQACVPAYLPPGETGLNETTAPGTSPPEPQIGEPNPPSYQHFNTYEYINNLFKQYLGGQTVDPEEYTSKWRYSPNAEDAIKNSAAAYMYRQTPSAPPAPPPENPAGAAIEERLKAELPSGPTEPAGPTGPAAPPADIPKAPPITLPFDPEIEDWIRRLLARGEKPVTRESIDEQYSPLAAVQERNARRQQDAAAEQLAQVGLNIGGAGGALEGERQKINESVGSSHEALAAQLIGDELQQRRQDVVNALGFAQGSQRIALQKQLGEIDNELKRQGLRLQELGLNNTYNLGLKDLDLRKYIADLGNTQFYENLGYNMGNQEYLNNLILRVFLGGLA